MSLREELSRSEEYTVPVSPLCRHTVLPVSAPLQGIQELVEGGRYKFITSGETNTIMLCIRKSKPQDEGYYKVVIANEHGEDSAEFQLFVSGKGNLGASKHLGFQWILVFQQRRDDHDCLT